MGNRFKHELTYIYWKKESDSLNIKQADFANLWDSLDPNLRVNNNFTVRKNFRKSGSWYVYKKGDYKTIYTHDDKGYHRYWCNVVDDRKNSKEERLTGTDAIQTVSKMFKEKYGISLIKAFGTCPLETKLICSPKQFYFTNDRYLNVNIKCLGSVDFSSHYPAAAQGKLPDYKTAVTVKGTVKPTEEYPFAIYKSGHLAEYNVFDTHDWLKYEKLRTNLFVLKDEYKGKVLVQKAHKILTDPDEDETILMKPSEYELGWLYQILYDKRKDNETFKNAMNSSIGRMAHSNYRDYKLAHIRAFVIARANAKMLDLVKKIGIPSIVQLCVDGIIYLGLKEHGEERKALGTLHQEFTGVEGRFRGMNQYILMKDGKVVKVKHGGYNDCIDKSDIDCPTKLEDINKWIRILNNFEQEDQDE